MKMLCRYAFMVAFGLLCAGCDGCGCGKKKAEEVAQGNEPSPVDKDAQDLDVGALNDANSGSIEVTVRFEGAPPPLEAVPIETEYCKKKNPDGLTNELFLVKNGLVQNAFVVVTRGLEKWKFKPKSEALKIKQEGCHYIPHVYGAMIGQSVEFMHADLHVDGLKDETHNVKKEMSRNPPFSFTQHSGDVNTVRFNNEEYMVRIQCDVHTWMKSYLSVVRHPYFGVTDENGKTTLPRIPPGEYTMEAMHEYAKLAKPAKQIVKVDAGKTAKVEFVFKVK